MSRFEIRELAVPADVDEQTQAGEDFRALDAFLTRWLAQRYGEGVYAATPQERLASLQPSSTRELVMPLAFDGDSLVGRAAVSWTLLESTDVCDISTSADPDLPEADQRALHELLVAQAEGRASVLGRTTLMVTSVARATGEVVARTGFGAIAPDAPDIVPLLSRGYELEQVYRVSMVDLDRLTDLPERLAAATERARDYEVLAWEGPTPAEHRPAMRTLHERMSTDAPAGALTLEPETWDEERLAEFERFVTEGGRTMRTVVVRHLGSGDLVGYSALFVGSGDVARQHDTLVLREHRGHRLGMVLKLANLAELDRHHPGHRRVTTWNAEENRPMLDVNEAVGFEPICYEGVWQRRVTTPG